MDREHILRKLIETIVEVQEMSGCASSEITIETCPIYDLEEFDSLRGTETTVLLAQKLGCQFKCKKGEVNIFVSKDHRRALRVKEIVTRLMETKI